MVNLKFEMDKFREPAKDEAVCAVVRQPDKLFGHGGCWTAGFR